MWSLLGGRSAVQFELVCKGTHRDGDGDCYSRMLDCPRLFSNNNNNDNNDNNSNNNGQRLLVHHDRTGQCSAVPHKSRGLNARTASQSFWFERAQHAMSCLLSHKGSLSTSQVSIASTATAAVACGQLGIRLRPTIGTCLPSHET